MLAPLANAGRFLIQTLFDFYIFMVLLRVVFHWAKIDARNPLLHTVARLTHPPLKPVYRIVPDLHGIDLAGVLLLLALEALKIGLLGWLAGALLPHPAGLLVLAFAELLQQLINLFFYAILALALLSWFNPAAAFSPLIEILVKLSEPLIRPVRQALPPLAGLDCSPLVVMIALKLLTIVVVAPLAGIGAKLALYGPG